MSKCFSLRLSIVYKGMGVNMAKVLGTDISIISPPCAMLDILFAIVGGMSLYAIAICIPFVDSIHFNYSA